MAINFSDTLASVYSDLNQRTIFFSVVLGVLLLLWFGWLLWAPLTIIKQASGFIEVSQPAVSLVASTPGRIESVNIRLGDLVKANEPLIKINGDDETKQIIFLTESLIKQREVLAALQESQESELQALEREIGALEQHKKNTAVQVVNVQGQYEQQAQMVALLSSVTSAVSKIELQREQLQLKQIHERLLIKQQALANLDVQHKQSIERKTLLAAAIAQKKADQQARIALLEGELSLQQQLLTHKTLSVPITAKVAQIMPLQAGQWINAGEPLATLLPEGDLRVVAQFKPVDAQGYLQVGQDAKIKIDNFPWLQYGALDAKVVQIDQAERQGVIRVVLALSNVSSLALQHGMSSSVNVTVATATPWQLLLQNFGRRQANL